MATTIYRDYGALGDTEAPNNAVTINPRRLVYQATHKGDGSRLPYMNRSFISFTYGGKPIEDFDLIATITNDRIDRSATAEFNDLTSTYDILEGLQYWGTHYATNKLSFTLATDGIELKTLDDFLYWFHAGEAKELILAEHPNRAILARVATPPQISLLPFELVTNVLIAGVPYPTKTTLYKGEITLEFVMDSPHWYARENILGKATEVVMGGRTKKIYVDLWTDESRTPPINVDIFSSLDALKILLEDGIPLASMIHKNMILGNGAYASVEDNEASNIWTWDEGEEVWEDGEPKGYGARINGTVTAADIEENPSIQSNPGTYYGVIAGPIVDADGQGISSLAALVPAYFYYAGTAPAPTIITFSLRPTLDNYYISSPSNKYKPNGSTGKPYDTFVIESKNKSELRFTTPNLYSSYNEAIKLIEIHVGKTWEELRQAARENIRHIHVRLWLNKIIKAALIASNNAITISSASQESLYNAMVQFLSPSPGGSILKAKFTFNSETGEATGEFWYQVLDENDNASFIQLIEDVGDMLRSNYIILRDRNYPTDEGFITGWLGTNDTTKGYSHRITHDANVTLSDILILYKNMYL